MERLTKISEMGNAYYPKCFEETCCGMGECLDDNCSLMIDACKKLAEYEQLEEQGLLVRLPCKVGDTVFRINEGAKNPIIELTVAQINIIRKSYNLGVVDKDGGELMYFKNDIGNSIFLTREEAEKKLEEIQNDKT